MAVSLSPSGTAVQVSSLSANLPLEILMGGLSIDKTESGVNAFGRERLRWRGYCAGIQCA